MKLNSLCLLNSKSFQLNRKKKRKRFRKFIMNKKTGLMRTIFFFHLQITFLSISRSMLIWIIHIITSLSRILTLLPLSLMKRTPNNMTWFLLAKVGEDLVLMCHLVKFHRTLTLSLTAATGITRAAVEEKKARKSSKRIHSTGGISMKSLQRIRLLKMTSSFLIERMTLDLKKPFWINRPRTLKMVTSPRKSLVMYHLKMKLLEWTLVSKRRKNNVHPLLWDSRTMKKVMMKMALIQSSKRSNMRLCLHIEAVNLVLQEVADALAVLTLITTII